MSDGESTLLFRHANSLDAQEFVAWARKTGKNVVLTAVTVFDVVVGTSLPSSAVKARFVDALTTDTGVDRAYISSDDCADANAGAGYDYFCTFVAGVASKDTALYHVTHATEYSVLDVRHSSGLLVVVNAQVADTPDSTIVVAVSRERRPSTDEPSHAYAYVVLSALLVFFFLSVGLSACSDPPAPPPRGYIDEAARPRHTALRTTEAPRYRKSALGV